MILFYFNLTINNVLQNLVDYGVCLLDTYTINYFCFLNQINWVEGKIMAHMTRGFIVNPERNSFWLLIQNI